jgi:outer membrane protein assembly factor BamB
MERFMRHNSLLFMGLLICFASPLPKAGIRAGEWSRFRGPDGTGVAADEVLPTELDAEKSLKWKVPAGKGASSPVVVGGRVFLTAFDGEDRFIACINIETGQKLWSKSVRAKRKEVATPPGGPANPTPVADESSVYAFFPDAGLFCFSHDGEQRWQVEVGPFHSFHGIAASLVLADGKVFVLSDQLQDSYLAAFDRQNGDEAWRATRLDGPIGGYSTPATRVTSKGLTELVVSGPIEVVGYDVASGARNWFLENVTNAPISVPVVGDDEVFVCEPSFTENPFPIDALLRHDKNDDGELSFEELESQIQLHRVAKRVDESWGNRDGKINKEEVEAAFKGFIGGGGLVAIQLDESQPEVKARVKWAYRKSVPQIPAPLLLNDVLFIVNDGGILSSVDRNTGEVIKRGRLEPGGSFYASPVAAAGKLFLVDTDGNLTVVSGEGEWKILATSQLNEPCFATPAIAGGRIFIRGESNLYCFGEAS